MPQGLIVRALLLIIVAGIEIGCGQSTPWKNDADYLFLHRGARFSEPECSLAAVTAAITLGADGVEVDIRMTLDGVLVCFHDDDTLIKGRGYLPIESMSYLHLRFLDFGSWFGDDHVATIAEFENVVRIAKANGLFLHIDVKTPGIYRAVEEVLDRYEARSLIGGIRNRDQAGAALDAPWLADGNLWRKGIEANYEALGQLMEATSPPFRASLADVRFAADLLGRRPAVRPVLKAVPSIPGPKRRESMPFSEALELFFADEEKLARKGALAIIHFHRDRALKTFAQALTDKKAKVTAANAAAWALPCFSQGHVDDWGPVPAKALACLDAALAHDEATVREMGAFSAHRLGGRAESLIERLRHDPSPRVRAAAAWSIGQLGIKQAIPHLLHELTRKTDGTRDTEWPVYHAVLALGRLKDPKVTEAIIAASKNKGDYVGFCAVQALADIGGPKVADFFGYLLQLRPLGSGPDWVVVHLFTNVVRVGKPMIPHLVITLARNEPRVARETVFSLARLGTDVVPPLRALVRRKSTKLETKLRAISVCRLIGGQPSMTLLGELAESSESKIREAAALAIEARGGPRLAEKRALSPRRIAKERSNPRKK